MSTTGDLLLTDRNRVLLADGTSLVLLSGGAALHGSRIILALSYLSDESGNLLTDGAGNPFSTGMGGWLNLANGVDFALLIHSASDPIALSYFQPLSIPRPVAKSIFQNW